MKKLTLLATISFAFLLGCVTAHVISDLGVPPARAGTNPTKWEYFCGGEEEFTSMNTVSQACQQYANKFGKEGWELVSTDFGQTAFFMCFKRPL